MTHKHFQKFNVIIQCFLFSFGMIVVYGQSDVAVEGITATDFSEMSFCQVTIISCLIVLSIIFEMVTEKLLKDTDDLNIPFLHIIFNELTTLGFIGLILFAITKSAALSEISVHYFHEEMALKETIEILHMLLFLFVVFFVILCCIFFRLGTLVQLEWRQFERRALDIEKVVTEYCSAVERQKAWRGWIDISSIYNYYQRHREMVYHSLRLRFINSKVWNNDLSALNKQARLEYQGNDTFRSFPFDEYLAIISGEVMARLINIDIPTWVAMEVLLVILFIIVWQLGKNCFDWVMIGSGLLLILMNIFVYYKVVNMRKLLTPPLLFNHAQEIMSRNDLREKHGLPVLDDYVQANDSTHKTIKKKASSIHEDDHLPPYVHQLPGKGQDMSDKELSSHQKTLFGGKGNGVTLAMFSTRIVFLLTTLHFSILIFRDASSISAQYSPPLAAFLVFLMLLPTLSVTITSTWIAREGLYAFNVEHMKVPRVINKVNRRRKARQTLRVLRFIAEMKVHLRDKRCSERQIALDLDPYIEKTEEVPSAPELEASETDAPETVAVTPTAPNSSKASVKQAIVLPDRIRTRNFRLAINQRNRKSKKSDPYELEQERREIHTIFCLFDSDGSGSISKEELESLLRAITHDIPQEQIDAIMTDFDKENTGMISFDGFYTWCHNHMENSSHTTEQLIEEVFKIIDTDHNGEITVEEFIDIFKILGESLDHDDVRELVYQMDRNNDGRINLEEFSRMIRKHAV